MVGNLKGRRGNFNTRGGKSMEKAPHNPYFSHAGSAFSAPATQLRFTARVGKQISRCTLALWTTSDEANRRRRFICTSAHPRSSGFASTAAPLTGLYFGFNCLPFRRAKSSRNVCLSFHCHRKHASIVAS